MFKNGKELNLELYVKLSSTITDVLSACPSTWSFMSNETGHRCNTEVVMVMEMSH